MHEEFLRGQDIFQRYRILNQLGAGGFGAVFKAEQITTRQKVAIKVLLVGLAGPSDERQKRFWREVDLTGKLSNPHTVRLIDSGFVSHDAWKNLLLSRQIEDVRALETIQRFVKEDTPVMVLELVQGYSLREILRKDGPLRPEITRRICGHILESLAEAHKLGIVHRDLKPENIMLTGEGKLISAKVLDFGIAGVIEDNSNSLDQIDLNEPIDLDKLNKDEEITAINVETITRQGQIRGTFAYMAPEQLIQFARPRLETDIYALGLILLECLTGNQAVTGTSLIEIWQKQIKENLTIPERIWDTGLGEVIEKATNKNPRSRYSCAEAMFSALDDVQSGFRKQKIEKGIENKILINKEDQNTNNEKTAKDFLIFHQKKY